MKIIDLLNKIANGEEVPKKIKVSCYEFEWEEKGKYYKNITNSSIQTLLQDWLNNASKLNNEVELIEEEEIDIQAIEKLDAVKFIKTAGDEDNIKEYVKSTNKIIVDNFYKVNDVIKMQNKLAQAVKQLEKRTRKEKE